MTAPAASPLVYVLNGPNLNLLGTREPDIYGHATLSDLERMVRAHAATLACAIVFRQTNHEGVLIDWLHEAHAADAKGVVLNAAAYTHTSIALLDAVKAIAPPVVEVHLSDPSSRAPFRHLSYVGMAASHVVKGQGADGYLLALELAVGAT